MDRKKDMIKTGGENVASREVEEVIYQHAAVQGVAVFGVPHPTWVEAVVAAVVTRAGTSVSAEELIAHCREHLAGFKTPKPDSLRRRTAQNPQRKTPAGSGNYGTVSGEHSIPLTCHRSLVSDRRKSTVLGRIARFDAPGRPFEIDTVSLPEVGAGEILVRVIRANICGSDVHAWHARSPPAAWADSCRRCWGHEMVRAVEELGYGVTADSNGRPLQVGTRVVFP